MSGILPQFLRGGRAWLLTALSYAAACCGAAAPSPAGEETPETLLRRAAAAERAGRTNEAVSAYEALLKRDASLEAAVAPRLVSLYVGGKQPAEALAWAARASRRQPDPKAYLAGVFTQLGQLTEAESLLRQAVREAKSPRLRVPLLWQLADAQEKRGDRASALATLTDARDQANEDDLKQTASQRLDALRIRVRTVQPAPPPQPLQGRDKP